MGNIFHCYVLLLPGCNLKDSTHQFCSARSGDWSSGFFLLFMVTFFTFFYGISIRILMEIFKLLSNHGNSSSKYTYGYIILYVYFPFSSEILNKSILCLASLTLVKHQVKTCWWLPIPCCSLQNYLIHVFKGTFDIAPIKKIILQTLVSHSGHVAISFILKGSLLLILKNWEFQTHNSTLSIPNTNCLTEFSDVLTKSSSLCVSDTSGWHAKSCPTVSSVSLLYLPQNIPFHLCEFMWF